MAERFGGLLQGKQQASGAGVVDAVLGQSGEDFMERELDIGESPGKERMGAEDVGAADDAGGVLAAFEVTLMVTAKLLATPGGGTAGDAVVFEEVTGGVGHENLQESN